MISLLFLLNLAQSMPSTLIGTSLPAKCTANSQIFYKSDATAGRNLYFCTATDTWTQQYVTSPAGVNGDIQINSSGAFGALTPGSGISTFLATPSSANLAAAVTNETGSGLLVFATSPTLTTPNIGVATATSVNKVTITAPATGSTLTIADGKTLTVNNSISFTGTDATTITFPSSSATVATLGLTNTFTGAQDASGAASTAPNKTGTSLPGTCGAGQTYFKSDATAGRNLYFCTATDTWTQMTSGIPGGSNGDLQYNNSGAFGGYTPGSGVVTWIQTPSSANLATAITDETGSGALVFATSPSFTTPSLGVASATSINKVAITAPATSATITIADGKTLTVNNSISFSGTDSTVITFPSSSATVATLGLTNTFTGRQDASGASSTAPIKVGTSAPGTCAVGDVFFNSSVSAGQNIYGCTATNTWTLEGDGGGGGGGSPGGVNGDIQYNNSGAFGGFTPGTGIVTWLGTPSSANLASAVTDETGSGALVFATSPSFTTPTLGVASATSINKVTITTPATGSTLTLADGKTLTVNNSITFSGTDSTTMTFPSSNATVATIGLTNTFTGRQDSTGAASTAAFKYGTTAPATCTAGDTFFDSDATAGSNFYGCTATNTWTLQGGSTSPSSINLTPVAFASIPAAGTAGRIQIFTDSQYPFAYDNGSTWDYYLPSGGKATDPTTPSWTWANQGTASIDTTYGGITMTIPSSTANWRIRYKTVPTAPYTIDVAYTCSTVDSGMAFAIGWYDGTKLVNVYAGTSNGTLRMQKWTNVTTYSADYTAISNARIYGGVSWLRIKDDNTNRFGYYSHNGKDWSLVTSATVGRTDFLTPTQVWWGMYNQDTDQGGSCTILSWKES